MENREITSDPRFRRAIFDGDYSRAVSVFLRIKTPGCALATIEDQREAASCVFDAIHAKHKIQEELEKEMR